MGNPTSRTKKQIKGMDKNRDLEDPLVHDDDGDVESPPLEDGEHRAGRRHVPHLRLLHRPRDGEGGEEVENRNGKEAAGWRE